jgi:fused signal recognition particle receptor
MIGGPTLARSSPASPAEPEPHALRFLRRGQPEPEPEPEPEPQPAGADADEAAENASEDAADQAADDLIGDEWQAVASPDDIVIPEPTELELDLANEPDAILGQLAPVVPVVPSEAAPEPEIQWAWGADYSPEKADAARREHEREQLEQGLEKSRTGFGARLRSAFGGGDDADWDEIEEILITGDVGARLSMDIVERARKRRNVTAEAAVRAELASLLAERDEQEWTPRPATDGGPAVVLVVGVNGTGKTTTIGKLAARERAQGRRVVLAAADTFRAAAIDQLRIWAQRTDSEIVAHVPDADPAAVVFDALDAAIARHADIVIADTAGRLHTKSNLMQELAKVRRVIDKRLPGADVETFFVLDATTGQNGLTQAKAFHDAVGLTGVVLTKLDSTAKGGIVFAIEHDLAVPVRFIGVGEQADDLLPFDPEGFVEALFD